MSNERTKAIILRRTNYGEADRVLKLITPNGQRSVMAKGVRKEKSRLAGGIELFAVSDITIHTGKGSLGILTSARLIEFFSHIVEDYDKLQFGYEVVKQVSKNSDNFDDENLFTLAEQSLKALDDEQIDLRITKTWFWLQLAILLGVGMNLVTDSNGEKLITDQQYNYADQADSFHPSDKGDYIAEHIKLLRLLSAQNPQVASKVSGIEKYIDDCLWVAERGVAH